MIKPYYIAHSYVHTVLMNSTPYLDPRGKPKHSYWVHTTDRKSPTFYACHLRIWERPQAVAPDTRYPVLWTNPHLLYFYTNAQAVRIELDEDEVNLRLMQYALKQLNT